MRTREITSVLRGSSCGLDKIAPRISHDSGGEFQQLWWKVSTQASMLRKGGSQEEHMAIQQRLIQSAFTRPVREKV